MSESMYWVWQNGDDFLIFPTGRPTDENGDPKVYGAPVAGPLSLYEAQRYVERAICDAPYRQRSAAMAKDIIEMTARLLCRQRGINPDAEVISGPIAAPTSRDPTWYFWRDDAAKLIALIRSEERGDG